MKIQKFKKVQKIIKNKNKMLNNKKNKEIKTFLYQNIVKIKMIIFKKMNKNKKKLNLTLHYKRIYNNLNSKEIK